MRSIRKGPSGKIIALRVGAGDPFGGTDHPFLYTEHPFLYTDHPFLYTDHPFLYTDHPFLYTDHPFRRTSYPFQGTSYRYPRASHPFHGTRRPLRRILATASGLPGPFPGIVWAFQRILAPFPEKWLIAVIRGLVVKGFRLTIVHVPVVHAGDENQG